MVESLLKQGPNVKILNACCQYDPAHLGQHSQVTNMDIENTNPHFKQRYSDNVLNFMQGDFIEHEFDTEFNMIVLGEVLEHCENYMVDRFLDKIHDTLDEEGLVVLTLPEDSRPKMEQYGDKPEYYYEYREGITSWHQNPISRERLEEFLEAHSFKILLYDECDYGWAQGHLVLAQKKKVE
jgi:2-polyprenyl-3-methyl-5-hydroxy-6-metoxy-1,4-benzoquinol methylase